MCVANKTQTDALSNSTNNDRLVPVRNKLFVLQAYDRHLSVFDTTTGKFANLSPTPKIDVGAFPTEDRTNCALVGGKIVVFLRGEKALCYDVEGNEWFEKYCPVARNLQKFSCLRVPKF